MDHSIVPNKVNLLEAGYSDDDVAQRETTPSWASDLARYTLSGLITKQIRILKDNGDHVDQAIKDISEHLMPGPYSALQPLVCNIRGCKKDGSDLDIAWVDGTEKNIFRLPLLNSTKLFVIDGQHRRIGFGEVAEFLEFVVNHGSYPKKQLLMDYQPPDSSYISDTTMDFWKQVYRQAVNDSFIAVEIHLGLNVEEERQLFTDLNIGNPISKNLASEWDLRNPINLFANSELPNEKGINIKFTDKDQTDWHKDEGALKRTDVATICSILITGKNTTKKNKVSKAKVDKRKGLAVTYWKAICLTKDFGAPEARTKTVLQQPIMLKAIARLAYDLSGFARGTVAKEKDLEVLWRSIRSGDIDFTHKNPVWQAVLHANDPTKIEEIVPGISEYIIVKPDTNLDAGTWDEANGWVRYGSRHNDLIRPLGDTIRYILKLEPRSSVAKFNKAT